MKFFAAVMLMGALLVPTMGYTTDSLSNSLMKLTRAHKWEQVATHALGFSTYHPQGFARVGNDLFLSSVEITEPTTRYQSPQDGMDRSPGKGKAHLFKMSEDGKLIAQTTLGEGDIYHPGGIDFDGKWLWVPVAEYRPGSESIIYRVDPDTLEVTEALRVYDHIGGVVWNVEDNSLHGISWGARQFYTWKPDADGKFSEIKRTDNSSFYIDYQDCAYAGAQQMLCSGVGEYPASGKKLAMGGLDLIDLREGRPVRQVPVPLWSPFGRAMTCNPVLVEPTENGLRALFMPDDDTSILYTYETRLR